MFRPIVVLFILYLLAACTPVGDLSTPTHLILVTATTSSLIETTSTISASETPSATATKWIETSPTPRLTKTPSPTPTQTLEPSITPTFDTARIVTVTPAPDAACPTTDPSLDLSLNIDRTSADYDYDYKVEESILNFLNSGGAIPNLKKALDDIKPMLISPDGISLRQVELTGDRVPEILLFESEGWFYDVTIFSCLDGKYETLFEKDNIEAEMEMTISDLNQNGIPDLVLAEYGCNSRDCLEVWVYEWDSKRFQNLIAYRGLQGGSLDSAIMIGGTIVDSKPKFFIEDTDHNGTEELILEGGIPYYYNYDYSTGGPWRAKITIFMWNGEDIVNLPYRFSSPEYRFQAVQDGDRESTRGNYEDTLAFYRAAISDDSLKSWSIEKSHEFYERNNRFRDSEGPTPTPLPELNRDTAQLIGYAYYRTMLIHVLLGQLDKAEAAYQALQERFPAESDGYPYVELAKVFWDGFQASRNIEKACGDAIAYTLAHPGILTPLGNTFDTEDYHGWQSLRYAPEDICPFK